MLMDTGGQERRRKKRLHLRLQVQYEKLKPDGSFGIPAAAVIREVSEGGGGFSFYSNEKIELYTKIRAYFAISHDQKAVVLGRIVHVMVSDIQGMDFIVGVQIENTAEEELIKLSRFVDGTDIDTIISRIPLSDVMDIHFMTDHPPIVKKIGKLEVTEMEAFDAHTLRVLLLSMLDEYRYEKFRETQELNYVYTHSSGSRFRVNLHIQRGNIEGIFRVIPSQIDSPARLGLPGVVENLVLQSIRGLIVVAGRTGSGKTTTLASMIELLNTKGKDKIIICIEDPIEYIHTDETCYIKQREVGRDTHSFISAAKNALRQNPDVLLIGEILDAESMEVAITAAETGTLVLTSIHAPDSAQALDRIVSFFPADLQRHMLTRLSLVLRGIITQFLVPRQDAKGLVMASEVLIVTSALRRVIRDGDFKQIPSLIETGKETGMQRITDSLMDLYERGIIDGGYLKGYI